MTIYPYRDVKYICVYIYSISSPCASAAFPAVRRFRQPVWKGEDEWVHESGAHGAIWRSNCLQVLQHILNQADWYYLVYTLSIFSVYLKSRSKLTKNTHWQSTIEHGHV